jgi:hypothetical protein
MITELSYRSRSCRKRSGKRWNLPFTRRCLFGTQRIWLENPGPEVNNFLQRTSTRSENLATDRCWHLRTRILIFSIFRFVFTRHDTELFKNPDIFPNAHLTVQLDSEHKQESKGFKAGVDYHKDFPVRVAVDRPIRFDTLISLFGCPINWNTSRPPQPIQVIHTIVVWPNGAPIGESPRNDASDFINYADEFQMSIGAGWKAGERLDETIRQLDRLVPDLFKGPSPPRRSMYGTCPHLNFSAGDETALDAWVAYVSTAIRTKCRF